MPSATFSETVTIDSDPANVWDQLQEPDVWASLGPVQKVWDPIFDDGVLTGFTWSTDIGGKVYEGTGRAISHQRPDRYELMLDTSEMSGTITAELSPANPGGTEAVVAIELKSKGLLSSMFFPAIKNAIGSGFPGQVSDMGARLSSAS
ncbi:MAG: SRPBCC family protein [Acidimicrobiia bacterium]